MSLQAPWFLLALLAVIRGWSRDDLARHLHESVRLPFRALTPSDDHGEGSNLRFSRSAPAPETFVSKFPSPEEIHIMVAGGTAGRFCR